jgi:hypothetical protein
MPTKDYFEQLLKSAHDAATAAQVGLVDNENAFDCGFAWVVIKGTEPLARYCRAQLRALIKSGVQAYHMTHLYGDKGYPNGWEFWKPGGSSLQSVHVHVAGANAFAEVLRAEGIFCNSRQRLD